MSGGFWWFPGSDQNNPVPRLHTSPRQSLQSPRPLRMLRTEPLGPLATAQHPSRPPQNGRSVFFFPVGRSKTPKPSEGTEGPRPLFRGSLFPPQSPSGKERLSPRGSSSARPEEDRWVGRTGGPLADRIRSVSDRYRHLGQGGRTWSTASVFSTHLKHICQRVQASSGKG